MTTTILSLPSSEDSAPLPIRERWAARSVLADYLIEHHPEMTPRPLLQCLTHQGATNARAWSSEIGRIYGVITKEDCCVCRSCDHTIAALYDLTKDETIRDLFEQVIIAYGWRAGCRGGSHHHITDHEAEARFWVYDNDDCHIGAVFDRPGHKAPADYGVIVKVSRKEDPAYWVSTLFVFRVGDPPFESGLCALPTVQTPTPGAALHLACATYGSMFQRYRASKIDDLRLHFDLLEGHGVSESAFRRLAHDLAVFA